MLLCQLHEVAPGLRRVALVVERAVLWLQLCRGKSTPSFQGVPALAHVFNMFVIHLVVIFALNKASFTVSLSSNMLQYGTLLVSDSRR